MHQGETVIPSSLFSSAADEKSPAAAKNHGGIISLADGWEFYPERLLTEEEIDSGDNSPIQTYIGRYLNLSQLREDHSPYGTSTYRLHLRYGGTPQSVTLCLPEVYSSCRVFAGGELLASSGTIEPYRPLIRDLFVTFVLEEDTSLVIQTANYSHYYSGMIFPPILGTAESIGRMVGFRMAFYGFLCFSSLAIALFSAAVWAGTKGRRNVLSLLFAGMALSFSARVCYPFFRLFGAPLIRSLYALEDGSAMFGIWCALGIAVRLRGLAEKRGIRLLCRSALGMAAFSVLFPSLILPHFPLWTGFYGGFTTWYKLLTGLFLILTALSGRNDAGQAFMATGTGIYGMGLAASSLLIGRFEPLRAGWPDEYGSFALVLCFAALMVRHSRGIVRENERLTAHLQEEVERQTAQICGLVDERQRLLSEFLHDLKSPAAAILNYVELVKENEILLDETARAQLETIGLKSLALSGHVLAMQKFALENPLSLQKETIELCGFLEDFHRFLQPDIELEGPDFHLQLPKQECRVSGDKTQLKRMLENLVYNAGDFTPPDGTITLSLSMDRGNPAFPRGCALIQVTDSGCGIESDVLPRLFDRFYTTRKADGGQGLGLYIVKTIAAAHGGTVTAESSPGKGSTFTVCLPLQDSVFLPLQDT